MSNPPTPPRFQFSLRWLLIAVTAIALLLGTSVLAANVFLMLVGIVLYWVLPTPLLIGAVYGRGDYRAFSIGALVPWVSIWTDRAAASVYVLSGERLTGAWGMVVYLLLCILISAICGAVAVFTRRWLERRQARDAD